MNRQTTRLRFTTKSKEDRELATSSWYTRMRIMRKTVLLLSKELYAWRLLNSTYLQDSVHQTSRHMSNRHGAKTVG